MNTTTKATRGTGTKEQKIAALPPEHREAVVWLALANNFTLIDCRVVKSNPGFADELTVWAWTTSTVAALAPRDGWTVKKGFDGSYRFTRDV